MIVATDPTPVWTVAEQLDALVLDALGRANVLFPITGSEPRVTQAASAWCQEFVVQTPGCALLDLTHFATGSFRVRYQGFSRICERACISEIANAPDLQAVLEILALANVVVIDGLSETLVASSQFLALGGLIACCANTCRLLVAPTPAAHPLISHPALQGLAFATDDLIAPDIVERERSALLCAGLMHHFKAQ